MSGPVEFNQPGILARIDEAPLYDEAGKILKSVGMILEAHLPGARIGSICRIDADGRSSSARPSVRAEVVGFREKRALLMAFDEATQGARIIGFSLVGASFGVLKVHGLPIDVSVPRRERKVGQGHRAFEIDADPDLSVNAELREESNLFLRPEDEEFLFKS